MSKLDELGDIEYIKNGRPQLNYGDGGSRWAGQAIDALIERIEELEAALVEQKRLVASHSKELVDARAFAKEKSTENSKLRELREEVYEHLKHQGLHCDRCSELVCECKTLDGGPVRANSDRLVDAIDSALTRYDGPQVEAIRRDLIAAVDRKSTRLNS